LEQAAAAAQARQRAVQLSTANPATAAAAAASAAQRPFDVSQLRLWNPLSGQCVPVRDPACELREVRGKLHITGTAALFHPGRLHTCQLLTIAALIDPFSCIPSTMWLFSNHKVMTSHSLTLLSAGWHTVQL
jgi:hypothetical protein